MIDIMGQEILEMSEKIINTLLKDQTTGNNICWGTEHYIELGQDYYPQEPITKGLIVGNRQNVIRPRMRKKQKELKIKQRYLHLHGYVMSRII